MKIEIAESLVFSWLRHVRGCVVAQTSWKPSPTWPVAREGELRKTFADVRRFADEHIGVRIFKQGAFDQFVRQTEIDVLGLRLPDGTGARSVIAVDTAFHEAGVNYGSADETIGRVVKKLIRAAFALEAYVDAGDTTVLFATPKMAQPIREGIERHLQALETMLVRQPALAMHRIRFRVVANRDFMDEIIQPVVEQADKVADTSELFMRAQQLFSLGEAAPRNGFLGAARPTSRTSDEGDKIGKHVRATMHELAASNRLSPAHVGKLLDPRYCKAVFNLGLPFLKAVDPAVDVSKQRTDENGYGRYWKHPLRVGNHDFLMCSQWFVWQRPAFDRWVRDLG